MKIQFYLFILTIGIMLIPGQAFAQLNGQNLGSGLELKFVQDTPTGFGNSTAGTQDSPGGSEINAVWGSGFGEISSGTLLFSISGNLEANFNKFFLFFDAVAGGQNVLSNTNVDGGFNEIQNLAGLTFDTGFNASHGLRIEVGEGFWGVRGFKLDGVGGTDASAFDVATGGGPGDLPLTDAGSGGVLFGWDNSNALGVTGDSATDALTATTGWEFQIDIETFFGPNALGRDILMTGFIASGDAGFLSNQVIGGLGGAGNLGAPGSVNFNNFAGNQFVTFAIPEPNTGLLILIGTLTFAGMRRRTLGVI